MLFAYGLRNEYRLTARAHASCVVRPTLIGFGKAKRRSSYRSSSFISFTRIIVAVTAAIAAYLQARRPHELSIAYRTRRGVYRGTMLLCSGPDWRNVWCHNVRRQPDSASKHDEIRERSSVLKQFEMQNLTDDGRRHHTYFSNHTYVHISI